MALTRAKAVKTPQLMNLWISKHCGLWLGCLTLKLIAEYLKFMHIIIFATLYGITECRKCSISIADEFIDTKIVWVWDSSPRLFTELQET